MSVTDTGVGMSEYVQRNCFALFGNLKFKNNINQGGMGLGLTASNLICKALGGSLNLIRSEKNVGSKFNFIMRIRPGSYAKDVIKPSSIRIEDELASDSASPAGPPELTQNDMQITRKRSLILLEETLKTS